MNENGFKKLKHALTSVAWSINQKVAGSITRQGICLGWRFVPSRKQLISLSLALPPSLSKISKEISSGEDFFKKLKT